MLATTGCPVLAEDKVDEYPMLIRGVVWSSEVDRGQAIDGEWTELAELRLGPADAESLGMPESLTLNLSNPESSPKLSINVETVWLVNDVGSSPEFCLESTVSLVDESQGSEHTIAEDGDCFDTSISFEFSADIRSSE